eukprot:gb/GECG01012903.1/.p1 GENE.gb/GECG01012903.1/~~gb/GECG01012903.1/.p1  ORF type:complete len:882 (+),score=133.60 gb/GECG01012903.1/:1-2646(+)
MKRQRRRKGKVLRTKKSSSKTENSEAASKPRFLQNEVLEAARSLGQPWPDVGPAGPFYGRTFGENELYNKLFDLPPSSTETEGDQIPEQPVKSSDAKSKGSKGNKKPQGGVDKRPEDDALASLLSAELARQADELIPAGYGIPKEDFIRVLRDCSEEQILPDSWNEVTDEGLERLAQLFRIDIESFHPIEKHEITEPVVNFQKRVEYSQWQEEEVIRQLREAEKREEEMEQQEAERLGIPINEVRRRQGKATGDDAIDLSQFFQQSRPWLSQSNIEQGGDSLEDVVEVNSEEDVPISEIEPYYYSGIFAQLCPGPLTWKMRYEDSKRMERITKNVRYHPLWHLAHSPLSSTPPWLDDTKVPVRYNTESFEVSGQSALNDIATLDMNDTSCHSYGCRWNSQVVKQVVYRVAPGEDVPDEGATSAVQTEPAETTDAQEGHFRKLYPYADIETLVDWRKFIVFLLVVGPTPKVLKQILNRHVPAEGGLQLRRSFKKTRATGLPFMLPLEHAYKSDGEVERLYSVPDVSDFATVVGTAWGCGRWPQPEELKELCEAVNSEKKQEHENNEDVDETSSPRAFSFERITDNSNENAEADGRISEEDALQQQFSSFQDESWLRYLSKCLCSWQNPASCDAPSRQSASMRFLMKLCEQFAPWFANQNITSKTDTEINVDKDRGMYRTPNEYGRMAELFENCCNHLRRQGHDPDEHSSWHHLLSGHVTLGSIIYSDFYQKSNRNRELEEEEYQQYAELADRNVYSSVSFGDAQIASILFLYLTDIQEVARWDWIEHILKEKQSVSQHRLDGFLSGKLNEVLAEPDAKILNDLFGWLLRVRRLGAAKARAQKVRRRRRRDEQKNMQLEDELAEKLRESDSDPKKKKKKGSKK